MISEVDDENDRDVGRCSWIFQAFYELMGVCDEMMGVHDFAHHKSNRISGDLHETLMEIGESAPKIKVQC